MLGQPVERARTRRLVLKLRQACRGAGIARREQSRVVAGMGEACFRLRDRAALRRGDEAEHDGALPDGFGQHLIVGGKLLDLRAETGERIRLRPEAQGILRRHAVWLGEHYVEADCRGTVAGELLHKLGKHGAWPGPLSDALQRFLVDVDDAEREIRVEFARTDLLVGIEHEGSQSRHRAWIPDPQGERRRDHCPYDEGIEQTRTHHCRQPPRYLNTPAPAWRLRLVDAVHPLQCQIPIGGAATQRYLQGKVALNGRAE